MTEQMKEAFSGLLTMSPMFSVLKDITKTKAHFTWLYSWKYFSFQEIPLGYFLEVIKNFPSDKKQQQQFI